MINVHIGAVVFETTLVGLITNGSNMSCGLFYFNRGVHFNYQKYILDSLALFQIRGVCRKYSFSCFPNQNASCGYLVEVPMGGGFDEFQNM